MRYALDEPGAIFVDKKVRVLNWVILTFDVQFCSLVKDPEGALYLRWGRAQFVFSVLRSCHREGYRFVICVKGTALIFTILEHLSIYGMGIERSEQTNRSFFGKLLFGWLQIFEKLVQGSDMFLKLW